MSQGVPKAEVQKKVAEVAKILRIDHLLDKGVGGFRIDAIVYIKKPEFKDGPVDGADGLSGIHEMTANTPGILDFLHEFRRNVFDGHDIFTVGEANGVSPEELPQWVGKDGVFSMLFEFSHLELSYPEGEIWCKRFPWKLGQLKDALSASQAATSCQLPRKIIFSAFLPSW